MAQRKTAATPYAHHTPKDRVVCSPHVGCTLRIPYLRRGYVMVKCRAPFPGQKDKGQGHTGRWKVLLCLLCGSGPFWQIHFICGTQRTLRWRCVAHHFWVKRSKVNVPQVVWRFCRFHSMAPSFFDGFTSYVVHKQHMRWLCVACRLFICKLWAFGG